MEYMKDYDKLRKEIAAIRAANLILDLKFKNVFDKGQRLYKGHCIRVAMKFRNVLTIEEIVAGLLHDLFEDTDVQDDDLRNNNFTERSIWLISMLTRNKRFTYQQNIQNIVNTGDVGLMLIKLADNIDNANPDRLHYLSQDEYKFLSKRYKTAREILLNGISQHTNNLKLDLTPLDFE